MRLFGLIGYPLSHTFSKKYFDEKFVAIGASDYRFENFPIENINELTSIIKKENLVGLSITSPHKKGVLAFLHEMTDAVKTMGSCNCVKIRNHKLYGYNTDVIGFENSFKKYLLPHHKQALILGSGGAAAAVAYSLQQLNIPYSFVSRNSETNKSLSYEELNESVFQQYQIIINASPIGSFPNIEECPEIPYEFATPNHYFFDVIYNPSESKFLRLAKLYGAVVQNGLDMLKLQAEANWLIWNGP